MNASQSLEVRTTNSDLPQLTPLTPASAVSGATSICLLVVIGITSLPSVGGSLSRREFRFVQSGVGWAALLLAVLHNALLGWDFMVRNYSCSTPSAQQVSAKSPRAVILRTVGPQAPVRDTHCSFTDINYIDFRAPLRVVSSNALR